MTDLKLNEIKKGIKALQDIAAELRKLRKLKEKELGQEESEG